LVEKHPGYPQELMLWTDTQQDWYWYAGSQTLFEFQGHRLKVKIVNTYLLSLQRCGHNIAFFPWISIELYSTLKIFFIESEVLINTCMLDTLWGPYNVYFCHVWFQSMQWFFCNIFQKGPILNSIPGHGWLNELCSWIT
jgi:hypothetical protein